MLVNDSSLKASARHVIAHETKWTVEPGFMNEFFKEKRAIAVCKDIG